MSALVGEKVARTPTWKGLNRRIRAWLPICGIEEEDAQRAFFEQVTGKRSLGACSEKELRAICDGLRQLNPSVASSRPGEGRAARRAGTRPLAGGSQAKKARALWLALYHLGEIQDPKESALHAFGLRQTGVASLSWMKPSHLNKVIEALSAWCARAGFDPAKRRPAMLPEPGTSAHGLKARLAAALWLKLHPDATPDFRPLAKWIGQIDGNDVRTLMTLHVRDLDRGIEALGAIVRKTRTQAADGKS